MKYCSVACKTEVYNCAKKEEPNVSEQENRSTLERFFEAFERRDLDALDDLVHDDYVEEYPQSGKMIGASTTYERSTRTIQGCRT